MSSLSILRACNPCALRPLARARWNGQTGVIRLKGGAYARFGDMVHGIRAGLRCLDTYRRVHGLHSPAAIIRRWAPPADNNPTSRYAAFIARRLGIAPDDPIPFDHDHTERLVLAIIAFETGGWQPEPADLAAALRMMATEEERSGRDPAPYRSRRLSDDLRRQPARRPGPVFTTLGAVLATVLSTLGEAGAMLWSRVEHLASPDLLARLGDNPALLRTALIAAALALVLYAFHRKGPPHADPRPATERPYEPWREQDRDPRDDASHPDPAERRHAGLHPAPGRHGWRV